jgi:hypothetical protein
MVEKPVPIPSAAVRVLGNLIYIAFAIRLQFKFFRQASSSYCPRAARARPVPGQLRNL